MIILHVLQKAIKFCSASQFIDRSLVVIEHWISLNCLLACRQNILTTGYSDFVIECRKTIMDKMSKAIQSDLEVSSNVWWRKQIIRRHVVIFATHQFTKFTAFDGSHLGELNPMLLHVNIPKYFWTGLWVCSSFCVLLAVLVTWALCLFKRWTQHPSQPDHSRSKRESPRGLLVYNCRYVPSQKVEKKFVAASSGKVVIGCLCYCF